LREGRKCAPLEIQREKGDAFDPAVGKGGVRGEKNTFTHSRKERKNFTTSLRIQKKSGRVKVLRVEKEGTKGMASMPKTSQKKVRYDALAWGEGVLLDNEENRKKKKKKESRVPRWLKKKRGYLKRGDMPIPIPSKRRRPGEKEATNSGGKTTFLPIFGLPEKGKLGLKY